VIISTRHVTVRVQRSGYSNQSAFRGCGLCAVLAQSNMETDLALLKIHTSSFDITRNFTLVRWRHNRNKSAQKLRKSKVKKRSFSWWRHKPPYSGWTLCCHTMQSTVGDVSCSVQSVNLLIRWQNANQIPGCFFCSRQATTKQISTGAQQSSIRHSAQLRIMFTRHKLYRWSARPTLTTWSKAERNWTMLEKIKVQLDVN